MEIFFFPSLLLLCQLWWKLPSSFKSHQEQGWILTQSRFTVDKCISSVKQTKDLFCSISHFLESVMEKLLTRKRKDKIHLTKGRPQRRTNKSAAWKYIPISVLCVQIKSRENNSDLNICRIGIWSIPQPRTSLQDASTSSTVLPLQKVAPTLWLTNIRRTHEICFSAVGCCSALADVKISGSSPSYSTATAPVTLRSQRQHIKVRKAESCSNGLYS